MKSSQSERAHWERRLHMSDIIYSTKLQKLQNRAARVIMRSSYDTDASVLLDSLRWDNLSLRR
jgi:hypothetical protein